MCRLLLVFTFIAINATFGDSYSILGVFPTKWTSHWKIGASIMTELAAAGHDVTVISPFELKQANVRNVVLTNYPEDPSEDMFHLEKLPAFMNFVLLPEIFEKVVNFTLSHPNVQNHLKSNEKFDLVIAELFHSEALFGFGAHYNCPVIAVTTFGTSMYSNIATGISHASSYVPHLFLPYTESMNFWQRLYSAIIWKLDEFFIYYKHFPRQRKLYEANFPSVKVPFDERRKSVSLLFNNQYFASASARPAMPNSIDIGGVHIAPAKPLQGDIKSYLDSATEGVVVFSMGSILKAVNMPLEKREIFIKAFGRLKQKVLWKYENETLPNKPDNVMISKWIPQRDILAHPNVKVFITHGGLLGTTEALTEGVPVLGIPVFGDQKMNMNTASSRGYAISLDYEHLSDENLFKALHELLTNSKYGIKAKEMSRIYNDRPMSPQKAVVYWSEYVVKHKGAPLLRSPGLKLEYFEVNSLDVIAFIIAVLTSLLAAFFITLKFFWAKIFKAASVGEKSRFKKNA